MMTEEEIKEIKIGLIEWVTELSDMNLLTALDSLRKTDIEKDWWNEIDESQRKVLNDRLATVDNTNFHSSEVFLQNLKND